MEESLRFIRHRPDAYSVSRKDDDEGGIRPPPPSSVCQYSLVLVGRAITVDDHALNW